MKLHHHIIAHVRKHHKKYIFGVGVISGITIVKIVSLLIIFMGITQTTSTDADYYDLEYQRNAVSGQIEQVTNVINEMTGSR